MRTYPSIEERFWTRVSKGSGCWPWKAGTSSTGYGAIWRNGKTEGAHRVAWEITFGPIPEGQWVLHKCDNPTCVNPDHLFLGNPQDNINDMFKKGRNKCGHGEELPQSKLSELDVREIKQLYASGNFTHAQIAALKGVCYVTIGDIIRGTTWKHVK